LVPRAYADAVNILYVVQHYNGPDSSFPGGGRAYEAARRLVARGHTVTLLCGTGPGLDKAARVATEVAGIQLRPVDVRYDQGFSFARRLLSFVTYATKATLEARVIERPDVVLASSTPLTVGLIGLVAASHHRVPLVFEVRDLWPELPIALGIVRNPALKWAAHNLADRVYRGAKEIVALSPGMRDGIVARGIPTERITVIPNAADTQMFGDLSTRDETRREFGWDGKMVAIHHGAMGRVNGLHYVLDCGTWLDAHGVESIHIALVGEGSERASLAARIEAQGIKSVKLYPSVPRSTIPRVLAAADVGLMITRLCPELQWNSANKLFEFLAAGLPVIVNYEGWHADLLRGVSAGESVSSIDGAEMGRVLIAMRDNPERRLAKGRAARQLAVDQFDRDRLVDRLEMVLKRACGIEGAAA
jgi:glycosyltransferase involved in cell wall biosynthesis